VSEYRFKTTRPELPAIEDWLPFAREAYAANWFTNFGALSRRLEDAFAAAWGFEQTACVVASSATVALAAPLIARRVSGRVVIPAFTFPATLSAVKMAGCTPVLADCAARDWVIDADELRQRLRDGAEAAIVVSPFGLQTDFSDHIAVAKEQDALLIIDNAAGLGVARANVEASPDVCEVFSLHATKPFGIGEGGVVFSHHNNAGALRSALNFGLNAPENGPHWGVNGKMAEIQAAIGLAAIEAFPGRLRLRRAFASAYMEALGAFEAITYPVRPEASAWQMFPVLLPTADAAARAIAAAHRAGMEARPYYRPSLSHLPDMSAQACPISEQLAARMVCFPVYSIDDGEEREEMVAIVSRAVVVGLGRGI